MSQMWALGKLAISTTHLLLTCIPGQKDLDEWSWTGYPYHHHFITNSSFNFVCENKLLWNQIVQVNSIKRQRSIVIRFLCLSKRLFVCGFVCIRYVHMGHIHIIFNSSESRRWKYVHMHVRQTLVFIFKLIYSVTR